MPRFLAGQCFSRGTLTVRSQQGNVAHAGRRVVAARRRQQERFAGKQNVTCNARMGTRDLKAFCALDEATLELLKMAMNELKLSARAYDRILKVARTIVDSDAIGDGTLANTRQRSSGLPQKMRKIFH